MSHPQILGHSPAIQSLKNEITIAARSEATILISGESGSGKELVAARIHHQSRRARGPFVAFNIAALNDQVTESELFGHKKGSFTGAHRDHPGLFMKAHGGTILLDEIGDIPLAIQTKLLRVLQEREIWPVGSNEPVPIDVRVIVATHRDLAQMVDQGKFRQDLYYRLNNYPIQVPALRQRGDDILLLFNHFLDQYLAKENRPRARPTAELMEKIRCWSWPGNVRELQNLAYAVVLRSVGDRLRAADIPPAFHKLLAGAIGQPTPDPPPMHPQASAAIPEPPQPGARSIFPSPASALDRAQLLGKQEMLQYRLYQALQQCNGNRTEAARLLNISRSTLYRSLSKMRGAAQFPQAKMIAPETDAAPSTADNGEQAKRSTAGAG